MANLFPKILNIPKAIFNNFCEMNMLPIMLLHQHNRFIRYYLFDELFPKAF